MTFRRLMSLLMIVLLAVGAMAVSLYAQDDGGGQMVPGDGRHRELDPPAADDGSADADADEDEDEDDIPAHVKQLAVAEAIRPSMVVVEYTLRFDKSERPRAYGSDAGSYPGAMIQQERPLEISGFLVSPTTVLTPDLVIHPRFIKSIAIRSGDNTVAAQPKAYATDHPAMFLEMDEPLPDTTPLEFDATVEEPYLGALFKLTEGRWSVIVSGTRSLVSLDETGRAYSPSSTNVVLVSEDGTPVGVAMNDIMPVDDSWKGSPLDWDVISAEEMAERLADVEATAGAALVRVALNFRSPMKRPGLQTNEDVSAEGGTERNVIGIIIGDKRVLVLADMRQNITRLLERIDVYPAEGGPVGATFVGSLKDVGAIIVELDTPLTGGVSLADDDIQDYRNRALMLAHVKVQGDNRIAYYAHSRIGGYQLGWQRVLYPVLPGDEEGLFLFDREGKLIVLPIARRLKTTIARGSYGISPMSTAAADIAFVNGDDLTDAFDANNVPLSEMEENGVAWLGVRLQPLNTQLARAYQVSDITNDGQSGAIVSYLYPGSPADQAGVQPRWILLRLNVVGQPKPLEVKTSEWYWETYAFPWENWDQLPEADYDRYPTPWPAMQNSLTLALTDIGYGTAYEAEFFVDGEVITKQFEVVQSPPHYDTAPRYENETLGITVRDMTFEVRRYFKKDEDAEGIVISKIEPGSLASVAGLKPHEIIVMVNQQAVYNVEDFEAAIADQAKLSLHVRRMTSGRNVEITMPVEPGDEPAADDDDPFALPGEDLPDLPAEE